MSRLKEVIKNKNKIEKVRRARRKDEIARLKAKTAFKAKLHDELRHIDVLLDNDEIDGVIIEVPDTMQSEFAAALYSDDLIGYDIKQVDGEANKFYVRKKFLSF